MPGWTTATWLVVSTSRTLFIRSKEITSPSSIGTAAPGQAAAGAAGCHWNLLFGSDFQQLRNLFGGGRLGEIAGLLRRRRQHLVVPVVLGDRIAGQQVVVADDVCEPRRYVAHGCGCSNNRKGCKPSTAPTNGGWML